MASKAQGKKRPAAGSLARLRARIDDVNLKLLRLISERARIAQQVGRFKQSNGEAIYQPAREREVIEKVLAHNPGPLTGEQVRRVFTEIISACRAVERELRVAYLGPEHTYSNAAARLHFGQSASFVPEASLAAVFQAVENDRAEFAVVPVENSTEGSVALTLDLLISTPLVIVGEILMPIRHALLSLSGDPAAVRRIISHQQSLAQCRAYLAANYPNCEQEAAASNAFAARRAARDPSCAAIASAAAAEAYGLKLLAENIQDVAHNMTRFLVMGKRPAARSGSDKTSVLFAVPERVGALHDALGLFARNSINLSMIQSRPQRERPWEYLFFADLGGHRDDPALKRALESLKRRALFLKVLGSYPEGRWAGV
jgi:chorismate mutase / prephenate dehydratase